jgi:hypothetical protein
MENTVVLDRTWDQFMSWYVLTYGYGCWVHSYATRVRSIINEASKNLTTKEIVHLKKQISYWKDKAGNFGGEELEEVVEERYSKPPE